MGILSHISAPWLAAVCSPRMSIQFQSQNFQHILRMCNTNVDGRQKVMFGLTAIKGIGRRFSNIICKKCDIDLNKRAGDLTTDEINKIVAVISNPLQFKIPSWMLNRQRDVKDGKTNQKYANFLDQALREDLERMKRVRLPRVCDTTGASGCVASTPRPRAVIVLSQAWTPRRSELGRPD